MMLIGILIELGKWANGRGFSALDIAKDLIRVLAGLCFYFAFSLPGKTKHQLAAFIAESIMLTGSLARTIARSLSRELFPQPPVLVDFEERRVAHRIRNSGTVTKISYYDTTWKANRTLIGCCTIFS